jgi:hypothetical protein
VYRTEGNGSIYYRLTPIATPTENDTGADTVTFVDTYADTAITGNELLYTDGSAGSELENIAPGASRAIASHQGRCFLVVGDNKVAFSKEVTEGEPVAFNDTLYIIPDQRGGNIVALASLDDKLVIFKERAIYVTYGPGPDFTGAGGYPTPQLVTSDVGCSDARTVVSIGSGVMFKTPKGIYLLDRSLQTTYIGAPVEDYNDLTVTSATLVASQNQVRFTTSGSVEINNEVRTGVGLVYDYLVNQWSTSTGHGAVGAVIHSDDYVMVRSTGRAYRENTTLHTDAGAFVRLRLTTSWLSFAGVQGFQRVYRVMLLGEYKSGHQIRARLGFDFSPAFSFDETIDVESILDVGTWGSSATWGSDTVWGGEFPSEWFRVNCSPQKCSSIRLSIEDIEGESPGESFTIAAAAFLVGAKAGTQKLNYTRSV